MSGIKNYTPISNQKEEEESGEVHLNSNPNPRFEIFLCLSGLKGIVNAAESSSIFFQKGI